MIKYVCIGLKEYRKVLYVLKKMFRVLVWYVLIRYDRVFDVLIKVWYVLIRYAKVVYALSLKYESLICMDDRNGTIKCDGL